MRHFNIYLIEDEVAQMYFNDEPKILQLFLEAEESVSPQHLETLQKQIDYITRSIPIVRIEQELDMTLGNRDDYNFSPQAHLLDMADKPSNAKLSLTKHCVMITASGGYEAETTFFEVLRNTDPCFLAMEFRQHRCGWLNPIRHAHFIRTSSFPLV